MLEYFNTLIVKTQIFYLKIKTDSKTSKGVIKIYTSLPYVGQEET